PGRFRPPGTLITPNRRRDVNPWRTTPAPEITDEVQGFVPTVTVKGKRQYVRFGGGLTSEWDKAYCVASRAEAFDIARRMTSSIYHLPGCVAVGADAQPHLV